MIGVIMLWLVAGAARAQAPAETLPPAIAQVRYPPLAEQARIAGDVRLRVNAGVVTPVGGHRLLIPAVMDAARALAEQFGLAQLDLAVHFVLIDEETWTTEQAVARSNAVGRTVLRLFGRKTHRTLLEYHCREGIAPPYQFKLVGGAAEAWIFGRCRCVQPATTFKMGMDALPSRSRRSP